MQSFCSYMWYPKIVFARNHETFLCKFGVRYLGTNCAPGSRIMTPLYIQKQMFYQNSVHRDTFSIGKKSESILPVSTYLTMEMK